MFLGLGGDRERERGGKRWRWNGGFGVVFNFGGRGKWRGLDGNETPMGWTRKVGSGMRCSEGGKIGLSSNEHVWRGNY